MELQRGSGKIWTITSEKAKRKQRAAEMHETIRQSHHHRHKQGAGLRQLKGHHTDHFSFLKKRQGGGNEKSHGNVFLSHQQNAASPHQPLKRGEREKEQWELIRHCQNICGGGIPAVEHRIDFPIKEPSSLSNKLVQWVSTEEELKSPSGERISRYCSINPPDLAGNVQLSQSLLILFVALLLMCERLGQVVQHYHPNLLSPPIPFFFPIHS